MAYTIYGDGEIWKDGRKYGTIYSDGEIWRDGELYAKVYSDGEIWKDSRKIGKIYDDGEVWINNASWGRIYCREEHTLPPTPMQNDYSETNNSAYSVPDIPDVGGGGVDWGAFGIFAAGFFILFLISCVVGVFVYGFDMWREFTVGRIEEFGFPGAIAAGILIVGVIYGFVTQFSKFNGGFIVGLIIQSVIICVASFLGAIVVAGIESFTLEGMNPIEYISMFIFMALFPALLCKLVSLVAIKLGWHPNSTKRETKERPANTRPQKAAVNNTPTSRTASPAPQAANTQRPAVNNPKTVRATAAISPRKLAKKRDRVVTLTRPIFGIILGALPGLLCSSIFSDSLIIPIALITLGIFAGPILLYIYRTRKLAQYDAEYEKIQQDT